MLLCLSNVSLACERLLMNDSNRLKTTNVRYIAVLTQLIYTKQRYLLTKGEIFCFLIVGINWVTTVLTLTSKMQHLVTLKDNMTVTNFKIFVNT